MGSIKECCHSINNFYVLIKKGYMHYKLQNNKKTTIDYIKPYLVEVQHKKP